MSKKVNAKKYEVVKLEETIIYADNLTECPWCGGSLESDTIGAGVDAEIISVTCMSCYATFPFKSARLGKNNPMADDNEIPF